MTKTTIGQGIDKAVSVGKGMKIGSADGRPQKREIKMQEKHFLQGAPGQILQNSIFKRARDKQKEEILNSIKDKGGYIKPFHLSKKTEQPVSRSGQGIIPINFNGTDRTVTVKLVSDGPSGLSLEIKGLNVQFYITKSEKDLAFTPKIKDGGKWKRDEGGVNFRQLQGTNFTGFVDKRRMYANTIIFDGRAQGLLDEAISSFLKSKIPKQLIGKEEKTEHRIIALRKRAEVEEYSGNKEKAKKLREEAEQLEK